MSAAVAGRGRIDKRQAMLTAAFAVFARAGYVQASVDMIAAEAGVAKATVYSHFGDKETLLREAIAASADQALADNLAAVHQLTDGGHDLRVTLEGVGLRLLQCHCDERSWALRRLLSAEINRFPDLLDIIYTRATDHITEALADRLARLTVTGQLHTPDPLLAAEQFFALLTGPMDKRARLGTRHVPTTELRALSRAAVNTFLRAFTSADSRPRVGGRVDPVAG